MPANEQARLLAIQKYQVPAALQEPVFQELIALAAHIFGLPVAFLSLVDSSKVDFPATHGVSDLHTLPREAALCSTAVQQHLTIVLNNISAGDATPQWHTAQRFNMEFYAGAPLLVESAYAVGALCLSDHKSRPFTEQEERMLEELAVVASTAIMARWQCLAQPEGAPRWQLMQQLATKEIRALEELVRYLSARHGQVAPIPEAVLGVVRRRLADIQEVFTESPSAAQPGGSSVVPSLTT